MRSNSKATTGAFGTEPSSSEALVCADNSPGLSSSQHPTQPSERLLNVSELLEAFRAGKSESTLRAYAKDLDRFSAWLGMDVLRWLATATKGEANLQLLRWQESMSHLAPRTVNRRTAAVRSLSKLASQVGLTSFELRGARVKVPPANVTGPSRSEFQLLLDDAQDHPRDYLILRLLHDLGLRRAEVSSLDLEDWQGERLAVKGKGRTGKEWLTVPFPTRRALGAYVGDRTSGPLLLSKVGRRLQPNKVAQMLYRRSQRVLGRLVSPHKIRHLAITTATERTGGNVPLVQAFSRHAEPRQVMEYVDNWKDHQGSVAGLVAQ